MSTPQSAPGSAAPGPVASKRGGWFAVIVIGSILTTLGGALLGAAAFAGVVLAKGGDGIVSTNAARVSAQVFAVTSPEIRLEAPSDADAWPDIDVTLTAGTEDGEAVFIGIGPSDEVADYLEGVHVAEVTGLRMPPFEVRTRDVPGSERPESPEAQDFWVASASGAGIQDLDWRVEPGTWTVVIMNADASEGIVTTVTTGVEAPWAGPVVASLITVAAAVFLIGIILTLVGAVGWGRDRPLTAGPLAGHYPAALTGELRGTPSRGLWLIKWILLFPHWIVLAVLTTPFVVTTIAAWFAILFTGRYPRSLFAFNVGVLRWTWRAAFYGYSALATDQYPPFSLQRTDYPADFDVAYPERLSRGLVLVKAWLLAIPHLVIVGVLTGGAAWGMGWMQGTGWMHGSGWMQGSGYSAGAGVGLLGLLVLVAAVVLLFAGRYLVPLFDLIMGVNRWAFRVGTYVALMRDEYPPFRLDQGATEPTSAVVVIDTKG
jgi:hypothetical protein